MPNDDRMDEDWTPPKPFDPPPEDPIERIEEEAEGTPFGEAASAIRELDRRLLDLQRRLDELDEE